VTRLIVVLRFTIPLSNLMMIFRLRVLRADEIRFSNLTKYLEVYNSMFPNMRGFVKLLRTINV
jgi:hypothetical protein